MASPLIVTPGLNLTNSNPSNGITPRRRRKTNCCELDHVKHSAYHVLMYAQRMTSGGNSLFFGSMRETAQRCRINKSTVNEAYKKLVADGWLIPLDEEDRKRGEKRYYQVLNHAQWVERHGNSHCSR